MEDIIVVFADIDTPQEENEEFIELIKACDMNIVTCFKQPLKAINFRTFIGKGKCLEIQTYLTSTKVDTIIFNQELSPLQIRNLEEIFQIPVLDRTDLILAIFEKRAVTPVARLQIESAQLKKLLPRLIGANTQLGRQSASGKNKGAVEKQLELDRRRIKARIHEVDRELKKVEAQRHTQRRARQRSRLPLVALVGYTNAGKSTIMNQLLRCSAHKEEKQVVEKDMLFATLDTSIRCIAQPHGHSFLLSDTVGFVNRLPHELIEAFHSTLEEVKYADMLLQVVDASDEEKAKHMAVTMETLREIGAGDLPMLTVFNKCDKTEYPYPHSKGHELYISAKAKNNMDALLSALNKQLFAQEHHVKLQLPYEQTAIYAALMKQACILEREDQEEGMYLDALLNEELYQKYQQYIIQLYA